MSWTLTLNARSQFLSLMVRKRNCAGKPLSYPRGRHCPCLYQAWTCRTQSNAVFLGKQFWKGRLFRIRRPLFLVLLPPQSSAQTWVASFIYSNGELYPRHSESVLLHPRPWTPSLPRPAACQGQLDLPWPWHFRTGAKIQKRAPGEIDADSDWGKKKKC